MSTSVGYQGQALTSGGHSPVVKVTSGGDPGSAVVLGQQESELSSARVGVQHITFVQGPV